MQKNTASQKWRVFAFNSTTNAPVTGDAANITAKISLDFAAASGLTDVNPVEIEDGYYEFDLTQAETNANDLLILPDSSTSNVVVLGCPAQVTTTPVSWSSDIIQTGDSFARLGAAGAGLTAVPWNASWDAEVESECTDALNAYDPPTNTEMTTAFTDIKGATWSSATDTLEHIRNKQTDIEADTQDLQTQVGTAGAGLTAINLPDQTMNITGNITGNLSGSVGSVTGNVAGSVGSVATGGITAASIAADAIGASELAADAVAEIVTGVLTTQMTESYATDGTAPTLAQALFAVQQFLQEPTYAGTTLTIKKLDGSTTAMTFTLDDGTNPTSHTRAT